MNISSNCTQAVSHHCNLNGLTDYASWLSSDGVSYRFWHGSGENGKLSKKENRNNLIERRYSWLQMFFIEEL